MHTLQLQPCRCLPQIAGWKMRRVARLKFHKESEVVWMGQGRASLELKDLDLLGLWPAYSVHSGAWFASGIQ